MSLEVENEMITDAAQEGAEQQSEAVDVAFPQEVDEQVEPQAKAALDFLDKISEDDNKPADATKNTKPEQAKPEDADKPKDEESELLETVQSDRGKERVRKTFEENKALKQEMEGVRDMFTRFDLPAPEIAQLMEFGRLAKSTDPQEVKLALDILEQQRTALAQRAGIAVPGVNVLDKFPDLKQAVADMSIDEAHAHEIARLRTIEQQQQGARAAQMQQQQQQAEFAQVAATAQQQMEAYLQSRAHEVDHKAKMQALSEHFGDQAKLQAFVQTYQPSQWLPTLQVMYDSIRAPQPAKPAVQPLRSRPSSLGVPASSGSSPMERVAAALDKMSI